MEQCISPPASHGLLCTVPCAAQLHDLSYTYHTRCVFPRGQMIVHMDGVDVSHPMAKRLAAAALAHHSEQLPHAMAAREAARQEMAAERRALFRDHRVRMAANSCMPAEHEEQPARELGRTKNKIIWRQRAAEQARKNELQRVRNRYVDWRT